MNYLAHCFLSGDNPLILTGNFLGDFVKGHDYDAYETGIRNGILLHRFIDSFTDEHPITSEVRALVRPICGHYSGVAVDMLYDYALAKMWNHFSEVPLEIFAQNVFQTLHIHADPISVEASHLLYYMERDNWFVAYTQISGLLRAMNGMEKRIGRKTGLPQSVDWLVENEMQLVELFMVFFPEILSSCQSKIHNFAPA
ncbi:MAG: ACP phosphodiesterase [Flavobacteriales bacterium]|nr:ACP phosphodiesterase [Flavobacteriales bacterium]